VKRAVAEPPSPLTTLLREERYAEFVNDVAARGLLLRAEANLGATIAGLHRELQSRRHPPGPTVEWLLIDRLVQLSILDERARQELA
jgi:hypothetical protein